MTQKQLEWYCHTETRIQAIEIDPSIAEHPTFKDYIETGLLLATHDSPTENYYQIETHSGTQLAKDGDFLIIGVEGEFYPCKRSVFLKCYQPVGNAAGMITVSAKEYTEVNNEKRRRR